MNKNVVRDLKSQPFKGFKVLLGKPLQQVTTRLMEAATQSSWARASNGIVLRGMHHYFHPGRSNDYSHTSAMRPTLSRRNGHGHGG
ncbi:hypothetical protein PC116_g23657 [Phytophthora cactorum]|uniref:Uncharacterized protein n=1 Tax=Phytophthora cactorum TaxID=29920 RepID=A0A8T1JS82_9STRA|nr:hypothetical protein PC117_g15271 [Phytophthora cactorum]KAG4227974.1 hypothetical protein PC116_g23657 [Phytophthora cactorum]